MIDPLVSLAFSLHSQKGVFALLLGSGVSRAAGIPTGWEIVQDLCRKLAALEGEDCEPDPAAWYHDRFGKDPDYADLLGTLGKTPSERQRMLREYFEPSEEERQEGNKTPTAAHKAIASLVVQGIIKVIITTNFDRLLEAALQEVSIQPTVIATPDAARGAVPLVHSQCTILKVHGDYLDTRIKNAPDELAKYSPKIRSLLDRILDEYGLVICGWSGDWDVALRAAIERATNRRFSTYWAVRNSVGETAQRLIDHRDAQIISGKDADQLFSDLNEKVTTLEQMNRQHPLSAKIAVARLKQYLEADKVIATHDLIVEETDRVASGLGEDQFPFKGINVDGQVILERMRLYESMVETLAHLLVTGCYWGRESTGDIWPDTIRRLANARERGNGLSALIDLSNHPALYCFYAAGIACIANNRWKNLAKMFNVHFNDNGKDVSTAKLLNHHSIVSINNQKKLPDVGTKRTPLSIHLFESLHPLFLKLIPTKDDLSKFFNQFEMIVSLIYASVEWNRESTLWAPTGRFIWDSDPYPNSSYADDIMIQEFEQNKENWPLYAYGFFKGRKQELSLLLTEWKRFISKVRGSMGVF